MKWADEAPMAPWYPNPPPAIGVGQFRSRRHRSLKPNWTQNAARRWIWVFGPPICGGPFRNGVCGAPIRLPYVRAAGGTCPARGLETLITSGNRGASISRRFRISSRSYTRQPLMSRFAFGNRPDCSPRRRKASETPRTLAATSKLICSAILSLRSVGDGRRYPRSEQSYPADTLILRARIHLRGVRNAS